MADHRYWRVYVTATVGSNMTLSIYETEMRGSIGPEEPSGLDLCTGGTASASHANADAYKLFDNNSSSYWINGSPGVDTWFQYDFGVGVDIKQLAILPRSSSQSAKDFSLQFSDNGTDWTTSYTWTGITNWVGGVWKAFAPPVLPPIVADWTLPFDLRTGHVADWALPWDMPNVVIVQQQWDTPFDQLPDGQQWQFLFDLSPDARQWVLPFAIRVERQWEENWKRCLVKSWALPVYYSVQRAFLLSYSLRKTVCHQWEIAYSESNTVSRQWHLPADLLGLNPVVLAWRSFWDLVPSATLINISTDVILRHRGNPVRLLSADIGISEDEYAWTGKMEIADVAAFQPMAVNDAVSLTLGGEEYALIIDNRTIGRDGGGRPRMAISVISTTALLASPRSVPIERTWDTEIQAKQAAEEIVGTPIEWNLVDWLIPAGHLAVYNAAPLEVVQSIAKAVGGVVETKPDGSLRVRHRFPVSVPAWDDAVVDHILTDVAHNLSVSESHRFRTRVNRVTVRGYQPNTGYMIAEVDSREDGLNGGHLSFSPGSTPYFLVHAGPGVSISSLDSSAGSLFPGAAQVFQTEEDLVFSETDQARLSRPAKSIDSWVWIGRSLGDIWLAPDGMSIMSENAGLAICRVQYSVAPMVWGLSSPSTLAGLSEFPVAVQITGTDRGMVGDQETSFQRGDGQFPGEDIAEPLLNDFFAKQSRGRAEIDNGESLQEVSLTCIFHPGAMPGQLAEIHDALMGQSWRGKIISVSHSVQGPTVTTSLGLLRHVSG